MKKTFSDNQRKAFNENRKHFAPNFSTSKSQLVNRLIGQHILLLFILGYEGAGAVAGGILLIIAPDGKLMDMPVNIMHGFFRDFLIPGIILLGLGILNTAAFITVLRRTQSAWLLTSLALGGLFI